MPSFYSWEEALTAPDDFAFNSTVVLSRTHHPPAGNLDFPNPNAPQGQAQMSSAVEFWFPTPNTSDSNQVCFPLGSISEYTNVLSQKTFAQMCWSTQVFQSMTMVSQVAVYRLGAGRPENNMGALVWQLVSVKHTYPSSYLKLFFRTTFGKAHPGHQSNTLDDGKFFNTEKHRSSPPLQSIHSGPIRRNSWKSTQYPIDGILSKETQS